MYNQSVKDIKGIIDAHREMIAQEGGQYVWTDAHRIQQAASHKWHNDEIAKLQNQLIQLIQRNAMH